MNACIAAMQPLFQPFRALGYISDDVPFAVQRRGKETFVTVSVGEAWQVSSRQYWLSRNLHREPLKQSTGCRKCRCTLPPSLE